MSGLTNVNNTTSGFGNQSQLPSQTTTMPMNTPQRKSLLDSILKGYKLRSVPKSEIHDRSSLGVKLLKYGNPKFNINQKFNTQNQQQQQQQQQQNLQQFQQIPLGESTKEFDLRYNRLMKEIEKGAKLRKVNNMNIRDRSAPNLRIYKYGQYKWFGKQQQVPLSEAGVRQKFNPIFTDINKNNWKLKQVKPNLIRDRSRPWFGDYLKSEHKIVPPHLQRQGVTGGQGMMGQRTMGQGLMGQGMMGQETLRQGTMGPGLMGHEVGTKGLIATSGLQTQTGTRIPIPAGTISTEPQPGYHNNPNSQFPVRAPPLHTAVNPTEEAFPGRTFGEKMKSAAEQLKGWVKEEVEEIKTGITGKGSTTHASTTTPSSTNQTSSSQYEKTH